MTKTLDRLEILIDKLRALPESKQAAAVDLLADLTEDTYVLSDAEEAAIDEAMEQARRGQFVSAEVADAVLRKPWR